MSGFDNCGTARTANCGACPQGQACGAGGSANVCATACVPESNATFCSRHNAECGTFAATDNCGASRTVSCGACLTSECVASSTCASNHCVSSPQPDGTRCGTQGSITDRNFCRAGVCQQAFSYCDTDTSSGQWYYQSNGVGGAGYGPCSCTTSTHLHFEYNIPNFPLSPQDDSCIRCAALGTRAVCF